jgi:hypothetical protein
VRAPQGAGDRIAFELKSARALHPPPGNVAKNTCEKTTRFTFKYKHYSFSFEFPVAGSTMPQHLEIN